MQLVASLMFDDFNGKYSLLEADGLSLWLMEREWNGNRRNISCVPRGEYQLVRHHGTKYPNTWALVGSTVAGGVSPAVGKSRNACVLHKARFPSDLEGCLCVSKSVSAWGEALEVAAAWDQLRRQLASAETHDLILN